MAVWCIGNFIHTTHTIQEHTITVIRWVQNVMARENVSPFKKNSIRVNSDLYHNKMLILISNQHLTKMHSICFAYT